MLDNAAALSALRNSEAAARARALSEELEGGHPLLSGFKDQASAFVEKMSDLIPDEVKDWGGEIATDFADLDLPFVGSINDGDEREQENTRERTSDDVSFDF